MCCLRQDRTVYRAKKRPLPPQLVIDPFPANLPGTDITFVNRFPPNLRRQARDIVIGGQAFRQVVTTQTFQNQLEPPQQVQLLRYLPPEHNLPSPDQIRWTIRRLSQIQTVSSSSSSSE